MKPQTVSVEMDYLKTGNKIGNLVADTACSEEAPNLHKMQMNNPKELPSKCGIDQDYSRRVTTFANWPYEDVISHKKLAKAGFFYEGNSDEVQCYSCGVKVKGWRPSDIAVRKHQELSPNCSYIASIFNKASKRNDPVSINNVLNSPSRQLQDIAASTSTHRTMLPLVKAQSEHGSVQPVLLSSAAISNPLNQKIDKSHVSHSMSHSVEIIERFPDFEKLKSEEERLKTFNFLGWPLMSPKPSDLAREGFFYLMEGDRVQCAFCRGVVSHWEPTDDPAREHSRHFAFCPFVMGRDVGNIPSSNYSPSYNYGEDICGYYHWRNSGPENGGMDQKKLEKLENFGVKLHHGPKHPSQASKDARFRSFVGWPESSPVQPRSLVEAGFFYIGVKDYTRCFYCDGGLCNWEAGDDPWEEHARWFQHCAYVRLNKGDAWVEGCLKKGSLGQKSLSQPRQHEANASVTSAVTDITSRVEELMNSDIIASAVRLGVFPSDTIKVALLKRIQTVGSNFTSHDELCDAIIQLQNMEQSNTTSSGSENSMDVLVNSVEDTLETTEESINGTMGSEHMLNMPHKEKAISPPVEDIIKEQRLCKICMDKEIGVLFLPCGHLMSCVECGPALTTCPFCRQKIKGTVRAFLT